MPDALSALVSIHDVMPETREQVTAMLSRLQLAPEHVTLLVVPGRDWSRDDIAWLRDLQQAGHPLAGHGWSHRCQPPVSLYHRLHSLLLSRRVAEHLSFSAEGIVRLVQDCHDWFALHQLTPSRLYVPPAWALGALPADDYSRLPFRYVETLSGVLDTASGKTLALPLVGFEADRPWRAWFLSCFNRYCLGRAKAQARPLRIGLHPYDLDLLLARSIAPMLEQVTAFLDYDDLLSARLPLKSSNPVR
ncbi:MAG: polysaccharide deacetylase family protein [Pseudomonadota bacterium]|nr:polysaccharide deacetylase family protein [Pseudomonadota bacterium]